MYQDAGIYSHGVIDKYLIDMKIQNEFLSWHKIFFPK